MAAIGINHVTLAARDLDETERFFVEVFGAERLASPNVGVEVRWLRIGTSQIHLLLDDDGARRGLAHFGITVDDLAAVYERCRSRGALDPAVNGHHLWELPDGVVQLYVRDPSGNLVEANARDASALPDGIRADLRVVAEAHSQSEQNLEARLLD